MDALVVALLSGLLGGGVSGALIGGFITLRQQRRAFDHEKKTRFVDLKRQRYADLLRGTDDWIRTLNQQIAIARGIMVAEASVEDMPTLGQTTAIEQLSDEIELLAPESVGTAAVRLIVAVTGLGVYAYDADRDLRHMIEPRVPFNAAMAGYTHERNLFVAAAKADLGTD